MRLHTHHTVSQLKTDLSLTNLAQKMNKSSAVGLGISIGDAHCGIFHPVSSKKTRGIGF